MLIISHYYGPNWPNAGFLIWPRPRPIPAQSTKVQARPRPNGQNLKMAQGPAQTQWGLAQSGPGPKNFGPNPSLLAEMYTDLGVESNWKSFEIRSIRFENLRFDWFERAKNIRKIRWKLIRNSFDSIRLQL